MQNESGITPVEYKVLVLPDEVRTKSAGGIIIPETVNEMRQAQEVKATVIEVGGNAFTDPPWMGTIPEPGNRVTMNKYAGIDADGKDGKKYRLVNDKEIAAIIDF